MSDYSIINAKVVTPNGVIENGFVYVNGNRIEHVGETRNFGNTDCKVIDAKGKWLMPGIIDIHNDAIEKELEPRPYALFPMDIALFSLESKLVWHGVTTIYHSLSFMNGETGVRKKDKILSNVEGLNRLKKYGHIRHCIHARYDITEKEFCPILSDMMENGKVQMLSFMDHTPGQGQYRKVEEYERFVSKYRSLDPESVKRLVEYRKQKSQDTEIMNLIDQLAQKARLFNIPMASHDDDSYEKVLIMKEKGVTISEFPVEIETAMAASEAGQSVVVGAPNIIRGVSNSGNMRAIDAVLARCADIMCSDYMPSSILHAIFILINKYEFPISQAVNMATLNPAKAVRLDKKLGSIENGKDADMILVSELEGKPFVEQVFVNGVHVMGRFWNTGMSREKESINAY